MNMLGLYGLLLLSLVAGISAAPVTESPRETCRKVDLRLFIPLALGVVLVTFFHEHLIEQAALAQRPLPSWMAALPAVPIMDLAPLYGHVGVRTSMAVEIFSLLEAGLMTALVLVLRSRQAGLLVRITIGLCVAGLATIALNAHGILSQDIYAYMADGLLGRAAYHPDTVGFGGQFHVLLRLWGSPPVPCAYGPAWLFPATLLMRGALSLGDGVVRFRIAGAASVLAVAVALVRLRVSLPVLLTFLLNPMIWMQYVGDAHNDLWPVALILFGRSYAHRPLVASILGGLAGAAKLPFLVVCCLTGASRALLRDRLGIALGSVSVALAISAGAGGLPYFHALKAVRHMYPLPTDPQSIALRLMALVGVSIAVLAALGGRRASWAAAFSFIGFGYGIFPWYAAWGLAYATLADGAEIFLCALPITAFLTATTYAPTPLWLPLLFSVFLGACALSYVLIRTRFFAAPPRCGRAVTPGQPFSDAACTRPT